jgi:hypothetical protein
LRPVANPELFHGARRVSADAVSCGGPTCEARHCHNGDDAPITDADLERFVRLALKTGTIHSVDQDTRNYLLDRLIDLYVVAQKTRSEGAAESEPQKLIDFARLDAIYTVALREPMDGDSSASGGAIGRDRLRAISENA